MQADVEQQKLMESLVGVPLSKGNKILTSMNLVEVATLLKTNMSPKKGLF